MRVRLDNIFLVGLNLPVNQLVEIRLNLGEGTMIPRR